MTAAMGEFDLIRDYFSHIGAKRDDVVIGVGDDGAVINPDGNKQLVSVMDTLVESIHFPRTAPARSIGHRILAVNLSDIAAMGASPCWASLSISMTSIDHSWLADFSAGFTELALNHGVQLIGGDTVTGPLVVTVQLFGEVEKNRYVLRSGAAVGDSIYVTGTLGNSAAGLRSMTRGEQHGWLVDRFLYPEPRVALGQVLGQYCSSAMDVSDGFGQDLSRMLHASDLGGLVDLESLPLSEQLKRGFDPEETRYLAISGGDDYELCVTVNASKEAQWLSVCEQLACPVTRVGVVQKHPGLRFQLNGKPTAVNVRGHDHFVSDM